MYTFQPQPAVLRKLRFIPQSLGLLQVTTSYAQLRLAHMRHGNVTPVSHAQAHAILANRRLQRPNSPHLSIYKAQTSWTLSALHRITGAVSSGSLYLFGATYAGALLLGIPWDGTALLQSFAGLDAWIKTAIKSLLAFPLVYHSLNGVRHLSWEIAPKSQITNRQVKWTGWTVIALSMIGTLGLTWV